MGATPKSVPDINSKYQIKADFVGIWGQKPPKYRKSGRALNGAYTKKKADVYCIFLQGVNLKLKTRNTKVKLIWWKIEAEMIKNTKIWGCLYQKKRTYIEYIFARF